MSCQSAILSRLLVVISLTFTFLFQGCSNEAGDLEISAKTDSEQKKDDLEKPILVPEPPEEEIPPEELPVVPIILDEYGSDGVVVPLIPRAGSGGPNHRCGNKVLEHAEKCDDGKESATCDDDCTDVRCGDGNVNEAAGETCDEGENNSDTNPGGCRTNCVLASCGDGNLDPGEECDEGSENSDTEADACRENCTLDRCGDNVRDADEECDEGPENSNTEADACREDCTFARCGDSVVDEGEECDEGSENNNTEPDACREDCSSPRCSDNVLDTGEACDDGNNDPFDGCEPDCGVSFDCDPNNPDIGFIQGTPIYVDPDGTDDANCGPEATPCATVEFAIGQADPNDTLVLSADTFFDGALIITENLFIFGQGPEHSVIDAAGLANRVFAVSPGVTAVFCGVQITGGNADSVNAFDGGGIFNSGTTTLSNSAVHRNRTSQNALLASPAGGGIYNEGASSILNVINSTITDNSAVATVTIVATQTTISSAGGGIYNDGGTVNVSNSFISNNTASSSVTGPSTTTQILSGGGGIYSTGGSVTLTDSVINDNAALSTSSTRGSLTAVGGGILHNTGMLRINGSTLNENLASTTVPGIQSPMLASGGAVAIALSTASTIITDSTLDGNLAIASGSGVGAGINTVIFALGAGVSNDGDTLIANSTLSNNRAFSTGGNLNVVFALGGGVSNNSANAIALITNSTISGNSVSALVGTGTAANTFAIAAGGGVDSGNLNTTPNTRLIHSTVVGNTATAAGGVATVTASGGGVFRSTNGIFTIGHDIIALNAPNNCSGLLALSNSGFNLYSDNSCPNGATDIPNTNPMLNLLADNGGPTKTHLPLISSMAVDRGDTAPNCSITVDQRGEPRPVDIPGVGLAGVRCDIGSVERQLDD